MKETEPGPAPALDLAALEALAYSHRGVNPSPRATWIGRQCVKAVPLLVARVRALEAQVAESEDLAAVYQRSLAATHAEIEGLEARLRRLTEACEMVLTDLIGQEHEERCPQDANAAYRCRCGWPIMRAQIQAALAPDARGAEET